jgi:hypothetical protein|tara:strand:- start:1725 stop:1973 length:249 start_codon:yes stop_codon:yes gene_type:complete
MKTIYLLYYGKNVEMVAGNLQAVHDKMQSLTPFHALEFIKTYSWVYRHLKTSQKVLMVMPLMFDFEIHKMVLETKYLPLLNV